MRQTLIYIVVFFSSFAVKGENFHFKYLTNSDGLSQSEVYSFCHDSQGHLWIGTVDGLNRYDGYKFDHFNIQRNNINAIPSNTIKSIVEDEMNRIWIGTDDGLCYYDMLSEKIMPVQLPDICHSTNINSLLYNKNKLLIGTNSGAFILNLEKLYHNNKLNINPLLISLSSTENSKRVVQIIKGHEDNFFVATSTFISQIKIDNIHSIELIKQINDKVFNTINSLDMDKDGNLWIASREKGLYVYIRSNEEVLHYVPNYSKNSLSSSKCSQIEIDNNNNIWIGTTDNGINLVNPENRSLYQIQFEHIQQNAVRMNTLNSNLIYSIYCDRENNVWIGTIGSGINYYSANQKKFNHYKIPSIYSTSKFASNFVRSIHIENGKTMWLGMHGDGLYQYDISTHDIKKIGFDGESIFHINKLTNSIYSICTESGVSLIQSKNNTIREIQKLHIGPTFYITKGNDDIYWIATINGILCVSLTNNCLVENYKINTTTSPALSNNNCRIIFFDSTQNVLFIGTEGGGLNLLSLNENYSPQDIIHYESSESITSISNNHIRSIIKSTKGDIWIGTFEGLNKAMPSPDGLSFKHYTVAEGLSNNMVQSILEDKWGNLWFSTNKGISQFNPTTEQFTNYTYEDGLQSNEFSEHTSFVDEKGQIYFGGTNGVSSFYPEKILADPFTPSVILTDFHIFNKRINVNEEINGKIILPKSLAFMDSLILSPEQNDIKFSFSSLNITHQSKIKYEYFLDGYDNGWSSANYNNRNAVYTNLPHGDYIFKVRCTNIESSHLEDTAKIFLRIKTPIYLTWYSFIIYLIAIGTIITYFIKHFETKKRILLENEHNAKIHELDLMRTRFFINVSHDLRTPLTLIGAPIEKILKSYKLTTELNSQLQLVNYNVKRLKYLIEQLLDIRKVEVGKLHVIPERTNLLEFIKEEVKHFEFAIQSKGLEHDIIIENPSLNLVFDKGIVGKILFNLLSNAIKYTEEGFINILINSDIQIDSQLYVRISVKDSGCGIPEEKQKSIFNRYNTTQQEITGYGIGLSHCKDLVETHNGMIEADSVIGKGSTFSFYLPQNLKPSQKPSLPVDKPYLEKSPINPSPVKICPERLYTLLLVEDNEQLRGFISAEMITTYHVIEASNGKEALEIIKDSTPDLIISDVMMPQMDGMELCRIIKSDIESSHIPVILLTAKASDESKYKGIETGADDYISKPFNIDYLSLRVMKLIESREQLKKRFQKNTFLQPDEIAITSIDKDFLTSFMSAIELGIPDSEFSIDIIEKELAMSRASLYRKIKSLTGMSAKEILLDMRMKRAHQLLSQNKLRITDVSEMVGYTNPKYFSKCFKEKYGYSPSEAKDINGGQL